ncbi:MAG: hypothetical protein EXR75_06495 [Myxococcales bacterium]|nr:hypothetical protein [Myxococcales bacterium]
MAIQLKNLAFSLALIVLASGLLLPACSDDGDGGTVPVTTSGGTGGDTNTGLCLLNSCSEDAHCDGCPDGRSTCLESENRCVACDPATGSGCKTGEKCSPYGLCVPGGLECTADAMGNPTVKCAKNSDCAACSPMHQVCDTAAGKCQACTATNTQHCLASDICLGGKCSPKCPKSCTKDNDCGQCGGPGNEKHACNNHKCGQCSDTFPCPSGQNCLNGICTPPCGLPGPDAGTCTTTEDCQFCGDQKAVKKWDCKTPVNDPSHGFCVPPANGCSDFGQSVFVLPPPFDQYTQACSKDADCVQSKAGITYNVGKLIKDLIGTDTIDVGFKEIKLQDANVTYPMPLCASVKINESLSCGICVPCKEDADCKPIAVNPILLSLFKGDAIASLAGIVLVQLIWGDDEDPSLHFFCQPVAAGYGACIPCGDPTQPCGKSGGGMGSGMCDHKVCDAGGPLNTSCSDCAANVCAQDSYCCDTSWDAQCVKEADTYCNNVCTGGGSCQHDPCTEGDALSAACGQCVTDICAADSFCCSQKWDSLCTTAAANTAKFPSCASACGGNAACAHDECVAGGALVKACSSCATSVCNADAWCCTNEWDTLCVDKAKKFPSCACN